MSAIADDVIEAVIGLLGLAEYADLSSLDPHWQALAEKLTRLPIPNWTPSSLVGSPSVSEVLASFPDHLGAKPLATLASELEEASVPSSNEALDDANRRAIVDQAAEFESLFEQLLSRVAKTG